MNKLLLAAALSILAANGASAASFSESMACRKLVQETNPENENNSVESHFSSRTQICYAHITRYFAKGSAHEYRETLYNAVDNTLLAVTESGGKSENRGNVYVPGKETRDWLESQKFIDSAMHE